MYLMYLIQERKVKKVKKTCIVIRSLCFSKWSIVLFNLGYYIVIFFNSRKVWKKISKNSLLSTKLIIDLEWVQIKLNNKSAFNNSNKTCDLL